VDDWSGARCKGNDKPKKQRGYKDRTEIQAERPNEKARRRLSDEHSILGFIVHWRSVIWQMIARRPDVIFAPFSPPEVAAISKLLDKLAHHLTRQR